MLFYYLSVGFYGVLLTLSNANRLHNRSPNTNMAVIYIQHSRYFYAYAFWAYAWIKPRILNANGLYTKF